MRYRVIMFHEGKPQGYLANVNCWRVKSEVMADIFGSLERAEDMGQTMAENLGENWEYQTEEIV